MPGCWRNCARHRDVSSSFLSDFPERYRTMGSLCGRQSNRSLPLNMVL